ncbi:MAG: hypothetical protein AAB609_00800 [Patescibacteria group bacterium]
MKKLFLPVYFFTLFLFVIFSYLFTDQNLSYLHNIYTGLAANSRTIATMTYVIFVLLFFVFYYLILKYQKSINIKKIILVTSGILFLAYPAILSYDIFNYIATSKVLFFYRENPYILMPIEFVGDPLLIFTRAVNKVALYGPVWIKITGISFILGFDNYVLTLFNFKLLVILFYLGTIFLVSKISKNMKSVFLFALSPLIIMETLVSSHNDIVMMFFALLSFYFLIKKRIFLSLIFIIASILIKYSTIFLFPVFIYIILKTIRKESINWERVFFISALSMMLIFFLSFLREEIYPWYAIWFLVFSYLIPQRRNLLYLSNAISFGLLLSYAPFMFSGTYSGSTPLLKIILIFLPVLCLYLYLAVDRKFKFSKKLGTIKIS